MLRTIDKAASLKVTSVLGSLIARYSPVVALASWPLQAEVHTAALPSAPCTYRPSQQPLQTLPSHHFTNDSGAKTACIVSWYLLIVL